MSSTLYVCRRLCRRSCPSPHFLSLGLSIKNIPTSVQKETIHEAIIEFCCSDSEVSKILIQKHPEMFKLSQKNGHPVKKHMIRRAAEKNLKQLTICMEKTTTETPPAVDVKPKSRGFGFATFEHHEVALPVLKFLNNNQNIFGDMRRPIVDFALEDKRALRHHETLLQKLRSGQKDAVPETESKKRKSYSRGEHVSFHVLLHFVSFLWQASASVRRNVFEVVSNND